LCVFALPCFFLEPLDALLLSHSAQPNKAPQQLTGLLCREPDVNGTVDLDVVLEEGGRRSLLFSKTVKDSHGGVMGREAAGMQSTVHCAMDVKPPKEQGCKPADLAKPLPTCSEVGQSGKCPCAAMVSEPLNLAYQRAMITETLDLCQAKARAKQPFRVLMFGLGGGAVPMYLRSKCESALIESVEHDTRVALVAQRLFGFKPDGNNKVEIADGEEAAARRARTNVWPDGPHYDVVLVDCFDGENHVASSCRSTTFVHSIHNILIPGGKVLQNVMDVDEKFVMPHYHATFGETSTQKREVQKGQILIVATTPLTHPSTKSHAA
jgi:hypothetical protein